jgi:hypothetical protein
LPRRVDDAGTNATVPFHTRVRSGNSLCIISGVNCDLWHAIAFIADSRSAGVNGTLTARRLLAELTSARGRYVPSYDIALIYSALGDVTQAMEWLERAYRERSHSIAFLRVDPALDPLRNDARFVALVRRTRDRTSPRNP